MCSGGWGMADGANPSLSFYSLNWRSIQFCFLSNIDICLWSYGDHVPWYPVLGGRTNLQNREMKSRPRI